MQKMTKEDVLNQLKSLQVKAELSKNKDYVHNEIMQLFKDLYLYYAEIIPAEVLEIDTLKSALKELAGISLKTGHYDVFIPSKISRAISRIEATYSKEEYLKNAREWYKKENQKR